VVADGSVPGSSFITWHGGTIDGTQFVARYSTAHATFALTPIPQSVEVVARLGDGSYVAVAPEGESGAGALLWLDDDGSVRSRYEFEGAVEPEFGESASPVLPVVDSFVSAGTMSVYFTSYWGGTGGAGVVCQASFVYGSLSGPPYGLNVVVLAHLADVPGIGKPVGKLASTTSSILGFADEGANGTGAVFKVDKATNAVSIVASFAALAADGTNWSGARPVAGLAAYGDSVYGTLSDGGASGRGTIIKIVGADSGSPSLNVAHSFLPGGGSRPNSTPLFVGSLLYGTTLYGGTRDAGTLYSLDTLTEACTLLHSFGVRP
jgi:uncharacterized repeat protein (TIGR03803 family)